jgi:hypothetical protein
MSGDTNNGIYSHQCFAASSYDTLNYLHQAEQLINLFLGLELFEVSFRRRLREGLADPNRLNRGRAMAVARSPDD